jgi:hypothetical protein
MNQAPYASGPLCIRPPMHQAPYASGPLCISLHYHNPLTTPHNTHMLLWLVFLGYGAMLYRVSTDSTCTRAWQTMGICLRSGVVEAHEILRSRT